MQRLEASPNHTEVGMSWGNASLKRTVVFHRRSETAGGACSSEATERSHSDLQKIASDYLRWRGTSKARHNLGTFSDSTISISAASRGTKQTHTHTHPYHIWHLHPHLHRLGGGNRVGRLRGNCQDLLHQWPDCLQ